MLLVNLIGHHFHFSSICFFSSSAASLGGGGSSSLPACILTCPPFSSFCLICSFSSSAAFLGSGSSSRLPACNVHHFETFWLRVIDSVIIICKNKQSVHTYLEFVHWRGKHEEGVCGTTQAWPPGHQSFMGQQRAGTMVIRKHECKLYLLAAGRKCLGLSCFVFVYYFLHHTDSSRIRHLDTQKITHRGRACDRSWPAAWPTRWH